MSATKIRSASKYAATSMQNKRKAMTQVIE
jgi:hypothetical protein